MVIDDVGFWKNMGRVASQVWTQGLHDEWHDGAYRSEVFIRRTLPLVPNHPVARERVFSVLVQVSFVTLRCALIKQDVFLNACIFLAASIHPVFCFLDWRAGRFVLTNRQISSWSRIWPPCVGRYPVLVSAKPTFGRDKYFFWGLRGGGVLLKGGGFFLPNPVDVPSKALRSWPTDKKVRTTNECKRYFSSHGML